MTQPESRLVRRIIQALNAQPDTVVWKIHGGPFQTAGLPDVIGVVRGAFLGVEVKMPGGRASARQLLIGARIRAAGGTWRVVSSVEEALAAWAAAARVTAGGEGASAPSPSLAPPRKQRRGRRGRA